MLKEGNHKHRLSLKKELILIFVLLLAGTLVVCGVVNSFFLEDFYLRDKEKKLVETYKALKNGYDAGSIGTEESVENLFSIFLRDTHSVISDVDLYLIAHILDSHSDYGSLGALILNGV